MRLEYDLDAYMVSCSDCHDEDPNTPRDLSDGGNNLTRSEATQRIRKHARETGHSTYEISVLGLVKVTR